MHKIAKISAAFAALAALGGSALAQTPPPPAHHGLLHNLFHRPAKPMPGHAMPYHPGMMPGHMVPGRPGMMGHPGMMGRPGMMGGRPGMMGGSMMPGMSGGIVGNRNTHVFHMPGDPGALPAPQNRVYFHTMQQAMAAGYHRAGGGRLPMRGGMMHGMPMHH